MKQGIAAIEMERRIASAWKKLDVGLKGLAEVLEDVIEPDQPKLFALDGTAVVTDVRTVLEETSRRLALIATRAAGDREGGKR